MNEKPNIVFIMADDMGYGDLGCYGAEKIPTPHVDRLAAEGVRFTDAHSSSAVCTPSRYSVMTGRYCWRTRMIRGVLGGFGAPLIEPGRTTVASLLSANGYATAAVGKWHLGLDWRTGDGKPVRYAEDDPARCGWRHDGFDVDYAAAITGGPTELGFDTFFGIAGSLDMPPYCFIADDHVAGTPDREKDPYRQQQRKGLMTPDWRDEEVDVTFAAKAVEFIEAHVRATPDRPFFLYLPTASPHRPCDIRPDFVRGASTAGDRGDMVVLFDWVVGQVTAALERLGVADNTLIIVTSDNGGRLTCCDGSDYGHKTNGDLRGQKADIWDGGHREPFVARWPGRIAAGATREELICLGDLLATCAAIVEAELPADAGEDSFSMLGTLLGQPSEAPARPQVVHHSVDGMFSIRRGRWKLIDGLGSGGFPQPRRVEGGPGDPPRQQYDLGADPAEQHNAWAEQPDLVADLTALLAASLSAGRTRPM